MSGSLALKQEYNHENCLNCFSCNICQKGLCPECANHHSLEECQKKQFLSESNRKISLIKNQELLDIGRETQKQFIEEGETVACSQERIEKALEIIKNECLQNFRIQMQEIEKELVEILKEQLLEKFLMFKSSYEQEVHNYKSRIKEKFSSSNVQKKEQGTQQMLIEKLNSLGLLDFLLVKVTKDQQEELDKLRSVTRKNMKRIIIEEKNQQRDVQNIQSKKGASLEESKSQIPFLFKQQQSKNEKQQQNVQNKQSGNSFNNNRNIGMKRTRSEKDSGNMVQIEMGQSESSYSEIEEESYLQPEAKRRKVDMKKNKQNTSGKSSIEDQLLVPLKEDLTPKDFNEGFIILKSNSVALLSFIKEGNNIQHFEIFNNEYCLELDAFNAVKLNLKDPQGNIHEKFVFFGIGNQKNNVFTYNFDTQKFDLFAKVLQKCRYFAYTLHGNDLYIINGDENTSQRLQNQKITFSLYESANQKRIYNIESSKQELLPSLGGKRTDHCCFINDNYLFVLFGLENDNYCQKMYFMDLSNPDEFYEKQLGDIHNLENRFMRRPMIFEESGTFYFFGGQETQSRRGNDNFSLYQLNFGWSMDQLPKPIDFWISVVKQNVFKEKHFFQQISHFNRKRDAEKKIWTFQDEEGNFIILDMNTLEAREIKGHCSQVGVASAK